MKFTGEYMTDEGPPEEIERHIARYDWATEQIKDMPENTKILDVACGVGYGTNILGAIGVVMGVDKNEDCIEYAKNIFNGEFRVMDATDLQIADNTFDVIVSFETIEHIDNVEGFVCEIMRVLKPGGLLIISFPNWPTPFRRFVARSNKFHKNFYPKSYYIKMFQAILKGMKIYGQGLSFLPFPGRSLIMGVPASNNVISEMPNGGPESQTIIITGYKK